MEVCYIKLQAAQPHSLLSAAMGNREYPHVFIAAS